MPTDKSKIQKERLERQRRYRARHKTFSLSYTTEEAMTLKREAQKRKMKVPEYIKAIVEAQLNGNGYIAPTESKQEELIFLLRKIGNNINQHTRHVHQSRVVKYKDIEMLQDKLLDIERQVVHLLGQPPEITGLLNDYLNQNPERLHNLITWLNNYHDHQDSTN